MKFKILIIVITFLVTACVSSNQNQLKPVSQIKPGVAEEGSLANAVLIADTTEGLRQLLGPNSITTETRIAKFVIQQPVGQPGSRAWREMWVVDPKGEKKGFIITFNESGLNAADFSIEQM